MSARARLVCILVAAAFTVAVVDPTHASTTATATRTENPSRLAVTVQVNLDAKRAMRRKVFVIACWEPDGVLACAGDMERKTVRLRKGRNRKRITVYAQAVQHELGPVPAGWDGNPATRSFMAPAPADLAFYSFGQDTRMRQVRPVGVSASREVLRQP